MIVIFNVIVEEKKVCKNMVDFLIYLVYMFMKEISWMILICVYKLKYLEEICVRGYCGLFLLGGEFWG